MAEINITTVREMIDSSFYEEDTNTVNFKMIQNVLFILARQLQILQRHVSLEHGRRLHMVEGEIKVTEIKVHSKMLKGRKGSQGSPEGRDGEKGGGSPESRGSRGGQGAQGGPGDQGGKGGPGEKGGKGGKAGPGSKGGQGGKGGQEAQGSSERKEGKGGPGISESKGGQGGKGGQEAQESSERKEGKGGPGTSESKGGQGGKGGQEAQGSSERKEGKGGPGTSESKGGQGGKGGQEAQESSERKEGKGGPGTSESEGVQGAKERQNTLQDQGGQEDQGAKGPQRSPDSKKKQGGQTQGENADAEGGKQSKEPKTSDKSATKSTKGKTSDPSVTDDDTTLKAATGKSQGKSGDRKRGKKGEDDDDDDDTDVLQEKLLVVSRTSSSDGGRGTVATIDQFKNMVTQIRGLQAKFGLEDTLGNEALRGALHKETSLSHPIAAVNMSSRLEAAEKKLAAIMPIVTDLARKTPGIDMNAAYDDIFLRAPKTSPLKTGVAGSDKATPQGPPLTTLGPKQESDEESLEMDAPDANFALLDPSIKGVTHIELNENLDEMYDAVMKIVAGASKSNYNAADGAMKRTQKADTRLDQAVKVDDVLNKLDTSVEQYTDKINDLDGRLTSQMTNYQDELMQMQHHLECGLDAMAEVLAAPSEDAAAIAELNGYFSSFQLDIERTLKRQKDMRNLQMEYSANLDELKQKIKDLQDRKSTRDEVVDALSDKAGIADLNGLVTMEQYQAVRGDFEKRIGHAYDKFNNKELTWQKAIDDFVRELNEKTDSNQLIYLNKEVQKYLTLMREYLDDMLKLVGVIDPITTTRKVIRSGDCLSCGTKFDSLTDEDHLESRPPVIGTETPADKEDPTKKYHKKCYPGYPLRYPIDPRSLICHHYCGSTGPGDRESAFKMQISELNPNQGTKSETDGKVNLTKEHKKPCMPCNVTHVTPGTPPDSIRVNILVSGPIETMSNDEAAANERGIMK